MSASPVELAQSQYVGAMLGYLGIALALPVVGVYFGVRSGRKKGKRVSWEPIIVAIVVSTILLVSMDSDKTKREIYEKHGLIIDG